MDCDGSSQCRFSCKHGTREEGGKAGVEQEITEGTEMEGQQMWMPDSGNAISILFLRYLRFLLFNPKPINQQKETEKGKQKTEIEGGKAGVEQERTEGTEMEGQQMWMPDSGNAISILFLRYLRFLLFNPKPNSDSARSPWPTCWLSVCRARAVPGRKT